MRIISPEGFMLGSDSSIEFLRRVISIILVVSLAGVAFSGTLTYRELFAGAASGCSVGGAPLAILDLPACVYGLAMYSALAILSAWALFRTRPSALRAA
jgi:uncharacterized membrane protein